MKKKIYLTPRMIESLDEDQLRLVKSETWKNGKRRCEAVGIYDVSIEDDATRGLGIKRFSWSDGHGDPIIYLKLDQEIRKLSHDNWEFSLSVTPLQFFILYKHKGQ